MVLSPLMSPFCLYLPSDGCKDFFCTVFHIPTLHSWLSDCADDNSISIRINTIRQRFHHRTPYMKELHQRPMDVIQHFAWVCDLWWYVIIVFVLSIILCSSLRLKKMKEARHACGVNEYNYLLKVGPFPWYPCSFWLDQRFTKYFVSLSQGCEYLKDADSAQKFFNRMEKARCTTL